ncbi:4'-phosphopantetheinyl transferase family protein [Streptomyces coerulescens]|uniref:4'-phosphopantetheinyl transferase family protein n=1 Tax=Streptomyces coerulescens TaxID=29304 RepID=A0ABW0CMR1_STRCD
MTNRRARTNRRTITDRGEDQALSLHSNSASHGTGSPRRPAPDAPVAVDLWLVRYPVQHSTGRRLAVAELDARERTRAAAFLRPPDALLYTAAHIALRRLLAAALGLTPEDVSYVREPCPGCGGPHGRPALRPGPAPVLHFSLSHSSGRALVALATAPVGVDIQRMPSAQATEVCVRRLHPGERAELEELPQDRRGPAFGQLWARKEAYLKGIGTGLERPAHADYLGTPGLGRWLRPPHWTVLDLPGGPAHTAAVAVLGTPAAPLPVRPLPMEWLYEGDAARVLTEIARLTGAVRVTEAAGVQDTAGVEGTDRVEGPVRLKETVKETLT